MKSMEAKKTRLQTKGREETYIVRGGYAAELSTEKLALKAKPVGGKARTTHIEKA